MQFDHLTKSYNGRKAVCDVSIKIEPGSIYGLLGANGAGKTTLIKMLLGLVRQDSASVHQDMSQHRIAFLPEHPYLPLTLSAIQIVSHASKIRGLDSKEAEKTLERVNLNRDYWHKPVRDYSKGMQQRTAIAYALTGKVDWLILDEPMSGLDALGRRHMLDILLQIKKEGVGILMCSHSVPDLVRSCDKIHIMAKGRICETITIEEHSLQEADIIESKLAHHTRMIDANQ